MGNASKYAVISIIMWALVDFSTTPAIRNPALYYSTYMPALLIFYMGFPALFALMIYKYGVAGWRLFAATLAGAFLVEVVFVHNMLLLTFPAMLFAIPFAVSIYSLITYAPKWIVDGTVMENKWKLALMLAVWAFIALVTIAGK
jgi:hypothetical protein